MYCRSPIDLADVLWKTTIDKLMLLPAGTRTSTLPSCWQAKRWRCCCRKWLRATDRVIVFDSPPLLAASEASLGHHMAIVMV